MELKIYSPSEDGFAKKIEWNHEEIKKNVAERVEHYKGLVYTDAQIQDAKKDRANLKKFVEALESKRKEIKKLCLVAYEQFEKQEKEIVSIVNEPIVLIDSQIKEYEQQKKDEKLAKVHEIFEEVEFPEWVTFEKIYDAKWLNVSVSLKSIKGAMGVLKERIEKDLATLRILPEFAFEAERIYISTLDIQKAITEANRMTEMQKAKAAHEAEVARKKAEEEARMASESQKQQDEQLAGQISFTDTESFEAYMNPPESEIGQCIAGIGKQAFEECVSRERQWVSFAANLTMADAVALKEFFESRNIEFKAL